MTKSIIDALTKNINEKKYLERKLKKIEKRIKVIDRKIAKIFDKELKEGKNGRLVRKSKSTTARKRTRKK